MWCDSDLHHVGPSCFRMNKCEEFLLKVTSLLKTYFVHWMEEGKLKHEIQDFCFELSVDLWRI